MSGTDDAKRAEIRQALVQAWTEIFLKILNEEVAESSQSVAGAEQSQRADDTPWMTVTRAAAYAKTSPKTLYREVAAGRLRAARVGGRRDLRLRAEWIDQWLESTTTPVAVTPKKGNR